MTHLTETSEKIPPLVLKNTLQKYAWGSHSAIQELMGADPTGEPWAELWMGAHPKAPSRVNIDGRWTSLNEVLRQFPEKILGLETAKKFNNTLPYLFKVLAAEQPLSIQAHPDALQAKAGFERESAAGIKMAEPVRNYKDPFHKPECICAVTKFIGLKGFRKIFTTRELIQRFCPKGLARELKFLERGDLKTFFKSVMELPTSQKKSAIDEARRSAKTSIPTDMIADWIINLHGYYPEDVGVLSPLFLNLFCLSPGEALFLPCGELHAYLSGMGIEIMANSDNVLRGGLTPKHVDVPELMQVLDFTETDLHILKPEPVSPCEKKYPVLAEEFELSVVDVTDKAPCIFLGRHGAEILICINGVAHLTFGAIGNKGIGIKKGESVFIPAETNPYEISGNARCYKAGVPL